jgi:hypothetical protein
MLGNLPLQYADGPDYCTVTDVTGGAFALTVQPDLMKLLEAHATAHAILTAHVEELTFQLDTSRLSVHNAEVENDRRADRIEELEKALREISDLYVNAPGWAAPAPSHQREYKMHQIARAVLQPKGAV